MCLYTKQKKPLIAKRDIIVYKQLDPYPRYSHPSAFKSLSFISPYKGFVYKRGFHYYQTGKKFDHSPLLKVVRNKLIPVEGQYKVLTGLHSFKSKKSGAQKMIIPKGAEYFIGTDNGSKTKAYCSDQLIFPYS